MDGRRPVCKQVSQSHGTMSGPNVSQISAWTNGCKVSRIVGPDDSLTRLPEEGIQGQARQQDVGPATACERPAGNREQLRPHGLVAGGWAAAGLLLSVANCCFLRPLWQAQI